MSRADDSRFVIGKQHWPAIGGKRTDSDAGNIGHHGVGLRARAAEWFGDVEDIGRMNLMHGHEMIGRNAEAFGYAAAILRDLFRYIVRSASDVEARIDAIGNAALAGEEAVRNPLPVLSDGLFKERRAERLRRVCHGILTLNGGMVG